MTWTVTRNGSALFFKGSIIRASQVCFVRLFGVIAGMVGRIVILNLIPYTEDEKSSLLSGGCIRILSGGSRDRNREPVS